MASVDIGQIFDRSENVAAFEKQRQSWDQESRQAVQKKKVSQDALVRVFHEGRVLLLTADEAEKILREKEGQDAGQDALKKNLEKALYGGSRAIAEELRVLFFFAVQSLTERIKDESIGDKEAELMTNNLRRRFNETEENISALVQVENDLTQRKNSEPIFAAYESKMAMMLRYKRDGQMDQAVALAKELERDKKQYLLHSRALEPLTYASYYHRLDLQKSKSRVLKIQQQLTEMRDTVVRKVMQELQATISADGEDLEQQLAQLEHSEKAQKFIKYQQELQKLTLEVKVLVKTISEVDKVCKWIETEVFKDDGIRKAAVTHAQTTKAQVKKSGEPAGKGDKQVGGMAIMDRLKKED
ncbi:MAG TPA: hypothetical protein PLG59_01130 [bacterium]|nr:hypothetical protein [bacterium]HQO33233.1 hypothetical protein [bacterium]HQP98513.1 hypothetical protein [bacterium]